MRPLVVGVTVGKKDERSVSILRTIGQDHLDPVHPRFLLKLIFKLLDVVQRPSGVPIHPGKVVAKPHQVRVL